MSVNNSKSNLDENVVTLKIVGVGGGGGNAINRMIDSGIIGDIDSCGSTKDGSVQFLAVNTDRQALKHSLAGVKIVIGEKSTKGRGAGGNPERGQKAAEESREEVEMALQNAQMVFVTAGMGGGTGTGAAPIVAEIAKEKGALTVAIVTKPFEFEGRDRMEQAELGILELRQHVDSLLVIPNDRLSLLPDANLTLANAFRAADNILKQATSCISKIVTDTGLINLDFADLAAVMQDAGDAHMGVGKGSGKDKAREAVEMAVSSPLLETSIDGARALLVNFVASPDIGLSETALANSMIKEAAHPAAKIFWGVTFDDKMKDEVEITVIATKFEKGDDKSLLRSKNKGSKINNALKTDDIRDDDFFVHLTNKLNSFT
ncbi:MAG: cell division protein FtsZ [Oscillospiraceae bacterium]|jgi:cell division protein FtsZ|nr:cell division protein FtsZ [Oscillospiraceae bacterium]